MTTAEELIKRLQCYPRHVLVTIRPVINLESVPCLDLEDEIIPELFVSCVDHEGDIIDDIIIVISESNPVQRIQPTKTAEITHMTITVQGLIEKLQRFPADWVIAIESLEDDQEFFISSLVRGDNRVTIVITDQEEEEEK